MKSHLLISIAAASALFLQGCTTTDAYTGEQKSSSAAKGAAIGAGIGALLGVATGDNAKERKKRALRAAGIGALAGGASGYYMDRQEAALREELRATGVSVSRNGENIVLHMPGNITFDVNSFAVKGSFEPILASVAKVLDEYEQTMIQVAGHTDSTGNLNYNMMLSQNRAQSVANVLINKGVTPVRINIVGFGPNQPVASNETETGRSQNRRVELTILPYTE